VSAKIVVINFPICSHTEEAVRNSVRRQFISVNQRSTAVKVSLVSLTIGLNSGYATAMLSGFRRYEAQ